MWFAPLLGGLVEIMGSLVGQALIALGIGYFTYSGIDTGIAWAKDQFFSSASALDPLTVQVLSVLRIDQCVNILVSALTAKMAFNGMKAGAIKIARLK
jgi:hypothetical protein